MLSSMAFWWKMFLCINLRALFILSIHLMHVNSPRLFMVLNKHLEPGMTGWNLQCYSGDLSYLNQINHCSFIIWLMISLSYFLLMTSYSLDQTLSLLKKLYISWFLSLLWRILESLIIFLVLRLLHLLKGYIFHWLNT